MEWYLPAGTDSSNHKLGIIWKAVCVWAPFFFFFFLNLWNHFSLELTFGADEK